MGDKMKYGYFDDPNSEYVITRPDTPRSWTNYLGSKTFGSIISNNAGGYSFIHTAFLGRFTRMAFNSIPMDQAGKYFYIKDNETGFLVEVGNVELLADTVIRVLGDKQKLKEVAQGDGNTFEAIMDCCRVYASVGEMCDVLRDVWGEYIENQAAMQAS